MAIRGSAQPLKTDPWWYAPELKEDKLAASLWVHYKWLRNQSSGYARMCRDAMIAYGMPADQIADTGIASGQSVTSASRGDPRLCLPMVASAVDTLSSKLSKNQPRPLFGTSGGAWKSQNLAKKLQPAVDCIFYETKAYKKGREAFNLSAICGSGYSHVYTDAKGRIALETLDPRACLVDEQDARDGNPKNFFIHRLIDKDDLIARFPGAAAKIEKSETISVISASRGAVKSNRILVVEAWHLPSYVDELGEDDAKPKKGEKKAAPATDGRHVICIDNATLLDEPWTRPRFPVVKRDYKKRPYGYHGIGIPEFAGQIQRDVNKMLMDVQRSLHLHSKPHWLIERGADVKAGDLSNAMGSEIAYNTGAQPPQLAVFQSNPPEVYQHIETQIGRFFDMVGISKLATTSEKPAGLNSGKALETFSDINSDRFEDLGKQDEEYYIELTHVFLDEAKDVTEKFGSYPVKGIQRGMKALQGHAAMEELDFKDIPLDALGYVITIQPVSSLPNTPAGKIEAVSQMIGMPPWAMDLLNFPDLEAYNKRTSAPRTLAEKIVFKILDGGKFIPPDPLAIDLAYALTFASQSLAEAEVADAPEAVCESLRSWIVAVQDAMPAAPAPLQQPAVAPLAPAPTPGLQPH